MINVLTSFRFFAAFFVFLHHTISPVGEFGERGVTYFFILSGFILSYRYYQQFNAKLNAKDLKLFYISRVARIYPVHVLTFLLAVILSFFVTDLSYFGTTRPLANLFLFQWVFYKDIFSFNAPSWSLSIEMIFYIFFPLVIYCYSKFVQKGKEISEIKFVSLILSLIFLFLVQMAVVFWIGSEPIGGISLRWWAVYASPFRGTDFCFGLILSLFYLKFKQGKYNIENQNVKWSSTLIFTILELVSMYLAFIAAKHPIFNLSSAKFAVNYVPSLSFLIFIFSFQRGLVSKLLVQKIFIILGEISFSFFMIHYLVIAFFEGVLKIGIVENTLYIFCISIFLSSIIYEAVEMPMRSMVKNALVGLLIKNKEQNFAKDIPVTDSSAKQLV